MLKVTVFGYRPVMGDVVESLQRAGVLQVDAHSTELPVFEVAPDDERLRALDEQLADIRFITQYLGRFRRNEQPFSMFVSEKFHVDAERYLALEFDDAFRSLYEQLVEMSDRVAHAEREIVRLRALVRDLTPWKAFRLQIAQWKGTEHTVLFTGTVPASESRAIRSNLRERVSEVTVEELAAIGDRQAWVVVAHRSVEAEVRSALASTDFTEVSFPGLADYAAEEIAGAEALIAEHESAIVSAEESSAELAAERYAQAVALEQMVESDRDRLLAQRDFGKTSHIFVIQGWIRADRKAELDVALAEFEDAVDLTLSEPGEDDEPPVELDNPKWLRPYEVLTDLYGRPGYRGIDPTVLMAPFFTLFFGICIGDVGYGAMLAIACYLIKTRIDVAPGVKRFMDLMIYGGFAGIACGVGFGSYFAVPIDKIPPFLARLQLLDPLAELPKFLLFTMILGVVQVFAGVVVAAYDAFRNGDPKGAVFGQLSTLFLFACIAVFVLTGQGVWMSLGLVGTMMMQGGALEAALGDRSRPVWDRMIGWLWLASMAAAIVLMGFVSVGNGLLVLFGASVVGGIFSKTARSAVIATLAGAYAVYGMSGFAGDILSYTRLAALGLSGSLVGFVFNLLAGLVWAPAMSLFDKGGAGIVFGAIVAVLAALVFVVGHVFNVVINLLGAFVHPARLQFVEFFGKFYEAGGRVFTPLRFRSESLVLEAGAAGSDGGAGT